MGEDECGDIPMVMVQNKIDLISQSDINQLEAEKLAAECNMKLYRTSVKEDLNVGVVFQHLAENFVNKMKSDSSLNCGSKAFSIGRSKNNGLKNVSFLDKNGGNKQYSVMVRDNKTS